MTLAADRRTALVELARRHGFLIVEDVAYRELGFDGTAPQSLWSLFDALPAVAAAAAAHTGPHVVLGAGRQVIASEPDVVRLLGEASRATIQASEADPTGLDDRVSHLQEEGRRPADLVSEE